MKPRIAIPEPCSYDAEYSARSLPPYLRAVEAAGGEPVVIPLCLPPEEMAKRMAEELPTARLVVVPGAGHTVPGDQPALFAVAQGIVKNDPEAIRAAAKGVPDLQAPGRDGATLLNFAVRQSWQRPESVEAVKTLLSLDADPNYTNGNRNSFAMANAGHASAPVLRAMLEAGGNANTRDEFGRPIILMNWYLGYYRNQARSRLELLLDHGADVNSAMPADRSDSAGYPLLLYRTAMGLDDNLAYADALLLLQRGADPNRAATDGMTFGKMLMDHRAHFQRTHKSPPQGQNLKARLPSVHPRRTSRRE